MPNANIEHKYTCKYCKNIYSRSDNLKRHEKSCAIDGSSRDDKLLVMFSEMQKTMASIAEKQGITKVTNVLMNLAPITDKDIQEHLEHLTIDFISSGAKGYADWANYYPFKDRLLCTDKSRKKLRYKNNDGELVIDGGGLKLATRFFQAISNRNEELINNEYSALQKQVDKIVQSGTIDETNLVDFLTKASNLQDILMKSRDAARGEENDLTREFITHLSKLL